MCLSLSSSPFSSSLYSSLFTLPLRLSLSLSLFSFLFVPRSIRRRFSPLQRRSPPRPRAHRLRALLLTALLFSPLKNMRYNGRVGRAHVAPTYRHASANPRMFEK